MTKRFVVFGGSGYLGGALVRELLSRGRSVVVADLSSDGVPSDAEFAQVDITDKEQVASVITAGDIVSNFAGIADLNLAKNLPTECIEINMIGNNNILGACVEKQASKYSYASSAYVYSAHGSFYRISKRTSEEYALEYQRKYGLPYLILRYGSLYGGDSNQSNGMHRMVLSAINNGQLFYDGAATDCREFIHVSDASSITADLLEGDENNAAYLLTGTERFSMEQLFSLIEEVVQKPLEKCFSNNQSSDHYMQTQYNFVPIKAKRISSNVHVDLGNGIMDLVNRFYVESLGGEAE